MFSNIYTEQKLDNGNILLVKKYIAIEDYKWQRYGNGDLLLMKTDKILVNCDNISKYNFDDSFIMDVSLDNKVVYDTRKFHTYAKFLNYLTKENVDDNWENNLYVQHIITHCQKINISLNMKIRMSNKDVATILL